MHRRRCCLCGGVFFVNCALLVVLMGGAASATECSTRCPPKEKWIKKFCRAEFVVHARLIDVRKEDNMMHYTFETKRSVKGLDDSEMISVYANLSPRCSIILNASSVSQEFLISGKWKTEKSRYLLYTDKFYWNSPWNSLPDDIKTELPYASSSNCTGVTSDCRSSAAASRTPLLLIYGHLLIWTARFHFY